jgi:hypothetical protein
VLNIQLEQILLQCRQTCRHHDVEKMGYMFRRPVHGSAGVDIGEKGGVSTTDLISRGRAGDGEAFRQLTDPSR